MTDIDFSKIQLLWPERWRLFVMRFKKRVKETFLGRYCRRLYVLGFISPNRTGEQDSFGDWIKDGTWSLTDDYFRFCVYHRQRFFDSAVWPSVVSAIVSLIVSYLVSRK